MVQSVPRNLSRRRESCRVSRRRCVCAGRCSALRRRDVGARNDGAGDTSVLCLFDPVSFLWFFTWRFLAGLSGGVIMVLAASVVLPHTSPTRRGLIGGVIFAGVGLGIA